MKKYIKSGTAYKRIDHVNSFDNGYVFHNDWRKMSDEEAESIAKQSSIDNPNKIFYVVYDDIMDSSSDIKWVNGEPYYTYVEALKASRQNSHIIQSASDMSNNEITNEYLDELFKNIDWDDVDYADKMIDRIIKRELGVDIVFDQAEYINMLDKDVKDDLMYLLENPDKLHQKRMKNKKSKNKKSIGPTPAKSSVVELSVKYEDYPDGNIRSISVEGTDRLDALKNMLDELLLYIDRATVEENQLSESEILNHLEERNGDGCDYIIKLTDETTGQVLMDYPIEEYDELYEE